MSYAGPRDLLEVDLSARSWRRTALGDEVFADALGGVGLAVRLIAILREPVFRAEVEALGGYACAHAGEVRVVEPETASVP